MLLGMLPSLALRCHWHQACAPPLEQGARSKLSTSSKLVPRCQPPRCCASERAFAGGQPPHDLDTVADQAHSSVSSALLSGRRHFRVEASTPSLDASRAGYSPAVLAQFALECLRALTVLDGPLCLLLPGFQVRPQQASSALVTR